MVTVPLGAVADVIVRVSLSGSLSLAKTSMFANVVSSVVLPLSALATGESCTLTTVTSTVAVLVRPLASAKV